MADEPVRGVEDRAARPVVAPQHDDPRVPVPLAELEDVADRRAAELVDRLVVVAHHGDVAVALGDERDELRLGPVRVLELVHEHVPEAPLDLLPRGRRLAQQPQGERHLVPEVDRAVRRQQPLVRARTPGPARRGGAPPRPAPRRRPRRRRSPRPPPPPAAACAAEALGVREERLGRDVLVLGPREQRRERVEELRRVAQRPVLVELQLEHVLAQEHDGLRTRQHPHVRRQPQLQRELPDQPVAERVERGDRGVRVAVRDQLVHADLHLVRGLVRERERQDLRRAAPAGSRSATRSGA